ncbi:MAG TPA: FG-GAP-like repeat-containing protein [Candidatus Eisenbacteria bacterium]|nr:FG-GAP-like repeat-containing protein [Candidatus Eisenbacteria bacterium]
MALPPRTRLPSLPGLVVILAFAAPAFASPPAPFLSLPGEAPGDRFGSSVAATGDLNGDGFTDIVIGAQWSDAVAPNGGRAYVYLGGPGSDAIADYVLQVPQVEPRAIAGYAVAIPGDLNGDGWNDIAIGSPISWLMGRVFLYWGGPSLDAKSDRILVGLRGLEFFGSSLAGVGDVNRDGYDDIWVGAPWYVPLLSSAERVGRGYLFYGGPTADGTVDILYEARPVGGVTDELKFGTSVAAAGDYNHDGFADILIGQPADGHFNHGRVYMYRGGNPPGRVPDMAFEAPADRFRAGRSVSRAGDFNADGYDDYIVGAPDSGDEGDLTAGRAYLYYGGQAYPTAAAVDVEFAGIGEYDAFGEAVAGDADVDGDGYADILVGAPMASGAAGIRTGKVYVYLGGPHADAVADIVLEGPAEDGTLGTSISLGDMDGDGVADAIVGAAGLQGSKSDPGHVFVYDLAMLPARAFAHDEHRTIPLNEKGAPIALRVEPVDGSFDVRDLDPATMRLRSAGAGDRSIDAVPAKRVVVSDSDRNGVEEMGVSFERADLARLFEGIRGRREVTASLEGALANGRRIAGDVALTIVVTGPPDDLDASVTPNPMNPEATLAFSLRSPGRVEARLFDASGRLVRTLAAGGTLPAGAQRLRIDGRDDQGRALPSGVYFYRLRTPEGERRGRVVVAK